MAMAEADPVRRLVQRVGLGPRPGEMTAALAAGFGATLQSLTSPGGVDLGATATPAPATSPTEPLGKLAVGPDAVAQRRLRRRELLGNGQELALWWLDRMAAVQAPFVERMTWFWHGHFATSIQKVLFARLMYDQNDSFRQLGRGDFRALAQAMIVDPAMLIWLDGQGNRIAHPNENLAREFMELFTLGAGNYTETDIRQAARALTGWRVDYSTDAPVFDPGAHDRSTLTVLGRTGTLDAPGFVDLLLAQPASPRFIAGRVWTRFVSDTAPDPATVDRLVAAYGPGRDVTALLRAAVSSDAFADPASVLVKEPVLWLVGALRALGVSASEVVALPANLAAQQPSGAQLVLGWLRGLGQVPFDPPNVGGWPAGTPWLTTATALTRLRVAQALTAHGDLSSISGTDPPGRIDATAELLGLGGFTDRTVAALKPLIARPPQLVALALTSPEYAVSA